ncbi:MAG: hypothetical protein MUC88_18855, partial [Planctomycetes bacterium]|nr:hypothetical protein [Planctomycetota bacterium]
MNPSGPPEYDVTRIYNPLTNSWSSGPSMPTRRYSTDSGVIQGGGRTELYVVGGYDGYSGLSTAERYIPSLNTWESVASLSEPRGHEIMTAVVGNNLYAIGGFNNGTTYYATNEMYDRTANAWVPKAPLPFTLQAGLTTVWDGKIYIFGGNNTGGYSDKTLVYDPSTNSWATETDIPQHRMYTDAATFGEYSYLIGGVPGGSPVIDVYDHVYHTWSTASNY